MRISDWSSDVCSSDLCTVFLNDPADYDGGALHVELGSADPRFKEAPGVAVVYPSHTLHEVEPVTRGERLVAVRSEEHTSELQSLMRNSYAVFCLNTTQ